MGVDAACRTSPLTHWDVVNRIRLQGKPISPLFGAPWVTTAIFRRDWLHAVDLGVACDFAGNCLRTLTDKFDGRNKRMRVAEMWNDIQTFYAANDVSDRLQCLVPSMIQQPKKGPKLRASAAVVRGFVPYLDEAAARLLSDADPVEHAVKTAAKHLHECYRLLRNDAVWAPAGLEHHSMRFCQLYVALSDAHEDPWLWRIKPKLHVFLELCREDSKPAKFWTYRDEDFGGSVARMSRRRGGKISASAFSRNVLERFKLKQPIIRVR